MKTKLLLYLFASVLFVSCIENEEDDIITESWDTVCCYGDGFAVRYFGNEDERDSFGKDCVNQSMSFSRSECDTSGSKAEYCEAGDITKYYWDSHFSDHNAEVNCSIIPNSTYTSYEPPQ